MKLPNVAMAGISLMLVLIGVGGFAAVVIDCRTAQQAADWPVTDGVVVDAGVRSWQESQNNGKYRTYVTRYGPEVTYSYEVGGARYSGHRIAIVDDAYDDEASARDAGLAGRDVGAHVAVHYDPADPEQALLDTSAPGELCLGIGAVGIAALGVFGIGAGLTRR